jgi:glycosyltransferase involved in cell wall biosynthesis
VLGEHGRFFRTAAELALLLEQAEADEAAVRQRALALQERAERVYRWEDVADRYEQLCRQLAAGVSTRGRGTGRRVTSGAPSSHG